jgi:hypothetical protein
MGRDKPVELLETYLGAVAAELGALPTPEIEEIVRELRSHALERLQGERDEESVRRTLARLGDSRAIAMEHLEARSSLREIGRAVPEVAGGHAQRILGRARATVRASGLVLGSVLSYGFAGCWLYTALAKPFHPARVGLWLLPDASGDLNLSLGSHGAGDVGRDLLGWWIVPLGLALAAALGWLTWRWNRRQIHRWRSARGVRSARPATA